RVNAQGQCVQDDMCPNIDGVQQLIPTGYTLEEGDCVKTTVNICTTPTACPEEEDEFCPDGSPLPPEGLEGCITVPPHGDRFKIHIEREGGGANCTITWGERTRTVELKKKAGSNIWHIVSTLLSPFTSTPVTTVSVQCGEEPEIEIEITKKKP